MHTKTGFFPTKYPRNLSLDHEMTENEIRKVANEEITAKKDILCRWNPGNMMNLSSGWKNSGVWPLILYCHWGLYRIIRWLISKWRSFKFMNGFGCSLACKLHIPMSRPSSLDNFIHNLSSFLRPFKIFQKYWIHNSVQKVLEIEKKDSFLSVWL